MSLGTYAYDSDSDHESGTVDHSVREYLGDLNVEESAVNMIVGGFYFSLPAGVIAMHPNSYFARAVNDTWKEDDGKPLVINRDGRLFKHIQNYLYHNTMSFCDRAVDWIVSLRQEADYYNIDTLITACDNQITRDLLQWGMNKLLSLNVLEAVADRSEVLSVASSHLLPSFAVCTVDVSGISTQLFRNLEGHNKQLVEITNSETKVRIAKDLISFKRLDYVSSTQIAQLEAVVAAIPLMPNIPMRLRNPQILRRTPASDPSVFFDRMFCGRGAAYCILQAAQRGGSISVTLNGITRTISKAGECLLHIPGCTATIEAVTAGSLIVMQCEVCRGPRTACMPTRSLNDAVGVALVAALHTDLSLHASVVLPLTRFYTLAWADWDNLSLETDPLVLQGQDADVYCLLCEHFEVTVVTVFFYYCEGECSAFVMGPSAETVVPNTNTADSNPASANTGDASTVGTNVAKSKVLIVSAPRGYGRNGRMWLGKKKIRDEPDGVMLVTALHIKLR